MSSLKVGWFQPLEIEISDDDYKENFYQIWEQMQYEYRNQLTVFTKIRVWVWKMAYSWIEFQQRLLSIIEP